MSGLGLVETDCFFERLAGRLGNPPVERGTLRGDVDAVRDCISEASVCAGDASRDAGIGGLIAGGRGETFAAGLGFSAFFFAGALRAVVLGGGDCGFATAALDIVAFSVGGEDAK